jgi:hypothetical protein
METKLMYVALDGSMFYSSEQCEAYDKKLKKEKKLSKDNFFDNIHTIYLKQDFYDISNKKNDMIISTPENFEDFLRVINEKNITAIYFGHQIYQKFLLDLFELTQREYQDKEKNFFRNLKSNLLRNRINNSNAIVFYYNKEQDCWESLEDILSKQSEIYRHFIKINNDIIKYAEY